LPLIVAAQKDTFAYVVTHQGQSGQAETQYRIKPHRP